MLLFSRVVTTTGSPRRAVPWALGVTEYVKAHSDLDVSLWAGTFGYPVGTLAWSTMVDSQVTLAASTAGLLADDGYFDLIEQAQDMIPTPPQDILRELVFGEPSDPPPIGAVATITTATALVDRMVDAVGWGVGIAQYVGEVTEAPVAVLTSVFGQMGEVAWIGVQPDLAAAEAARVKLAGDADYLARLAPTKDLFVPASGHTSQVTRLA
jgi:hypothetical protein